MKKKIMKKQIGVESVELLPNCIVKKKIVLQGGDCIARDWREDC